MVTDGQEADLARQGIDRGGVRVCDPPSGCVDCLAASALATELTGEQLRTLFGAMEVRKLSKNEILISEGDCDDRLYAVARGELEVYRAGAHGQDVLIRVGPGSIIGELAFLDGLRRTATVKAVNDECCVIALRRQHLESMLSTNPSVVYNVMRAIVRSAHGTVGKMDTVYTDLMHYISG
jgi:CRP-like cAMP-binding protein